MIIGVNYFYLFNVTQVNSGDSITIREEVYSGYPKEKQITLNNIIAPKLGRRP